MGQVTTLADAHDKILTDAADIANQKLRERSGQERFPARWGHDLDRFKPVSAPETRGKLTLEFHTGGNPDMSDLEADERQLIQRLLQEIGPVAIKEAILKNSDLFAGLIVGSAKRGRNYFDYFEEDDQLRLL